MSKVAFLREFARRRGLHAWLTPPRGADLFADLRNDLPMLKVRTVFDVGANVGQSAVEYLREFPEATIHSFEPVPASYQKLKAAIGDNPRFRPCNIGFGAKPGTLMMEVPDGHSDTAFVSDKGTLPVKVKTLDDFCQGTIDFLKIDVEGFELEVLEGAKRLLSEGRIKVAQVEVGMTKRDNPHVPFCDVKAFMEAHGMELFSIVGQTKNYHTGGPQMHRADAVFISERLIDAGRG